MSAAGWDNVPEQPLQEPTLQQKLGVERIELATKIERLKSFMTTSPEFRKLNYRHRDLLEQQLRSMSAYESILVERLTLLNQNED